MKLHRQLFVGLLLGAALASLAALLLEAGNAEHDVASGVDEAQPLYWVAPMDPDYRRDQPGKSPMGMDLLPVYAQEAAGKNPGEIRINPDVVNNLGVRTARVLLADWETDIRTVGYVTYDQDQLLHIHPRVAGWVESLHVKAAGDPVVLGQALYGLYSPELVNAQEEFLLAANRNNALLLEAAAERLKSLQMSDEFIERLRRTGKVMQTVTFRARKGGVVDNLSIREGFYVQPGTTMLSIATLDEVWVEAELFERQLANVQPGMPVTMSTNFLPGRVWQGTVDYIYPTLDQQTRTARVRLRFRNEDHLLKPNMFAQVTIHAVQGTQVLVIPRESLIRTGVQDRVVLALGGGSYKSVAVDVGRVGDEVVEVQSGLEAGDLVVASAQFLLDSESSKTSDFRRMHHD